MAEASTPHYRLRAELFFHDADVRGVAVSPSGTRFATASRDSTATVWDLGQAASGEMPSAPSYVLRGHNHFVNDVAFVDDDTVITGSSDHSVRVWALASDGSSSSVLLELKGHTDNVCHIAVGKGTRTFVTSSWDKTARVWNLDTGSCVRVLQGHEAAVWGSLLFPDGRIITVAADKTIRLWDDGATTSVILPAAHKDVVRSIAVAPADGFVTVSNDSSAIFWAATQGASFGPAQRVSDLHDGSFAYSVDGRRDPDAPAQWVFATGGEDNAMRVVVFDTVAGQPACTQTVMHPGTVWCAAMAANGDIVTGCSDGVARVFTADPARFAVDDAVAQFEKSVSERQISTKLIGGVDTAKLPSAEDGLSAPGVKDGENKIVKNADGGAEVHMWSASESRWVKVGDVVDGPGGGASMGGGEVNGKHYDFVFDVELGEGGQKAKLGYNRGENPYLAAQRFIDDNELNQDFLDQVANFVEQQVPTDALAAQSTASDPLTGGSRYVPRGTSAPAPAGGASGASRAQPHLPPPRKLIPHASGVVTYLTSDQISKIQGKLAELNTQLASEGSDLALGPDDASVFGLQLMPKLGDRSGATIVLADEDCAVIEKMMQWPTANAFPVLDVARLAVAQPSGGSYFFGRKNGAILDDVLRHMASPDANGPVLIMGCRFLCNLFCNRVVASAVRQRVHDILKASTGASKSENRKARETFASLLVNYAVSLHASDATPAEREPLLQTSIALIPGEKDEEVLYRLTVAMGTLMCGGPKAAQLGVELGAAAAAAAAAPVSPRLQQVATEIATLVAA